MLFEHLGGDLGGEGWIGEFLLNFSHLDFDALQLFGEARALQVVRGPPARTTTSICCRVARAIY